MLPKKPRTACGPPARASFDYSLDFETSTSASAHGFTSSARPSKACFWPSRIRSRSRLIGVRDGRRGEGVVGHDLRDVPVLPEGK